MVSDSEFTKLEQEHLYLQRKHRNKRNLNKPNTNFQEPLMILAKTSIWQDQQEQLEEEEVEEEEEGEEEEEEIDLFNH